MHVCRHVVHVACTFPLRDPVQVVAGFADSLIRVWSLNKLPYATSGAAGAGATAVPAVASSSADGDVAMDDGSTGMPRSELSPDDATCSILVGHKTAVTAVALSDDGLYLLSGGLDGAIRLWIVGTATTAVRGCRPAR